MDAHEVKLLDKYFKRQKTPHPIRTDVHNAYMQTEHTAYYFPHAKNKKVRHSQWNWRDVRTRWTE